MSTPTGIQPLDSATAFVVPDPFNQEPVRSSSYNACIVLQSSDGHRFHVLKDVLAALSPVFADMFALGGGLNSEQNSTLRAEARDDAVPLPESGPDLYHLLTWCDPRCTPIIGSVSEIAIVLGIADKYDLTLIMGMIKALLGANPTLIAENPIAVYAVAVRYRWEELARKAARESLSHPIASRPVTPELHHISAISLHLLNKYFYACVDAATANLPYELVLRNAGVNDRSVSVIAPYMEALKPLLVDRPTGNTVKSLDFHDVTASWNAVMSCDLKSANLTAARHHFRMMIAKQIDEQVAKVALVLQDFPDWS